MHIPDAVLGPETSLVAVAAMTPVWVISARRVRKTLATRQAPLMALGAAFCFTIMLFNIPAFGGTTAHPVGGALLAVVLGPWAAVVAVSVTLAVQALCFGDGGLLAFGANSFTMAFVLPVVGYTTYAALSRRLPCHSRLRAVCAGVGAYAGLNAAAAVAAVLLGLQPALHHDAAGRPLYFPFSLNVTLPAMMGTHLLIAGPVEAVVTCIVVRYLQAAGVRLYGSGTGSEGSRFRRAPAEALWLCAFAVLAMCPLGLLASGPAWGEWTGSTLQNEIRRVSGNTRPPVRVPVGRVAGYRGMPGLHDYASTHGAAGYLGAGAVGFSVIAMVLLLAGRVVGALDRAATARSTGESPARHGALAGGHRHATGPPAWLMRREAGPLPAGAAHRRAGHGFVNRTLESLAAGAARLLADERWSREPGFLQAVEPRAKLLGIALIAAAAAWTRSTAVLVLIGSLALVCARLSRIPARVMANRACPVVALFVAVLAAPLAFRGGIGYPPLLVFIRQPYIAITIPGLDAAARLALRLADTVCVAVLLTLTTRWFDLLRGLRIARIAPWLVDILLITYTHVARFLRTAEEMFRAVRSRSVGRATRAAGRAVAAGCVAGLMGKSLVRADEVHAAMLSRGWRATSPVREPWRLHLGEVFWCGSALVIAFAAVAPW